MSVYFFNRDTEFESFETKYPIGLYKLLIFYEEMTIFEKLYSEEKPGNSIISDSFSYALIINNPLLGIYLRNKYGNELMKDNQMIIESLLHYINEFTETNGSHQYLLRIKHFEQYFLFNRTND
jgi:hypothetical protein